MGIVKEMGLGGLGGEGEEVWDREELGVSGMELRLDCCMIIWMGI